MKEKFDMYNVVRYFAALSRPQLAMLLDWFSDSEKIEIPFTGDPIVAYTDGNLYIDRAEFMGHISDFYLYEVEWNYYGDCHGLDCPMGLSHAHVVSVLKYLYEVNDFIYWFEEGFVGYGDFKD